MNKNDEKNTTVKMTTPLGEISLDMLEYHEASKIARNHVNPEDFSVARKTVRDFLGAEDKILDLAWDYLSVIVTGLPFMVFSGFFRSILAGEGEQITPKRGFILSTSYVLGMAIVYTLAGIISASIGLQLQAFFNAPWGILCSFNNSSNKCFLDHFEF